MAPISDPSRPQTRPNMRIIMTCGNPAICRIKPTEQQIPEPEPRIMRDGWQSVVMELVRTCFISTTMAQRRLPGRLRWMIGEIAGGSYCSRSVWKHPSNEAHDSLGRIGCAQLS